MLIAKVTRKVLMNWYALSFTAIFTLGLTGAVSLTAARKTSFQPAVGAPIRNGVGDAPVSVVAGDFYFRYSGKDAFTFDDQSESLRKLNAIVATTRPTPAIQELINGKYPGGISTVNTAAVDGFAPAGWSDNPTLYQGVVRQYCRMCHFAQPQSFTKSSDFQGFANQIQHEVCETKDMPHAQVPFGVDGTKIGFWRDAVAQHDLGNFLHRQNISSCLPHD